MYSTPYAHQQFYSTYNNQQELQPMFNNLNIHNTSASSSSPSPSSKLIVQHCNTIRQKAKVITKDELERILDESYRELKTLTVPSQINPNLKRIIVALLFVKSPTLPSLSLHKFFILLQAPLTQIIRQWQRTSSLNQNDVFMFTSIIKLLRNLLKNIFDTKRYPTWLFDTPLLTTIANFLVKMAKSKKFFNKKNHRESKAFIHLFSIYIDYQTDLNEEKTFNKDILDKLIDPVTQCLRSNHYIDIFSQLQTKKEILKMQKRFFLSKCPSFLVSYNGSRLEQITESLLSTMLPQYLTLFNELIPLIHQWKRSTMRSINYLIKIVKHGSINTTILADHLPFIDHILTLVDTPILYNKLTATTSKLETDLMHTIINFLANMISEPTILAYIKQKKMTASFLRLTSAQYSPLVYDAYTILAHTTTEADIKEMHNPDALLSTVTESLKNLVANQNSDNLQQTGQLLEILKGLTQHDQIKEEILKQDTFSFLLECTKKFTGNVLTLLLETLWSLSFSQKGALELREHPEFLEEIQAISKNTKDEALKKASDGLVWKLVQEPAFLEKVAKNQEAENQEAEDTLVETKEVIIGADGKEQTVTKMVRKSITPPEQIFQYDIMISYCHADSELIRKIHQFLLDQGFKIWIDLNNMFGPAMSAMAEAVENCEFVIMCMSDSYKQSTYCQAEAEYAFGCKRRLLPLIVRPGYKPDGWLGFMIGSRIYVDFGRYDFDTACGKLMNEIGLQRKRPLPSKVGVVSQHEKPDGPAPVVKAEIEKPLVIPDKLPEVYTSRKATFYYNQKHIYRWTESDVLDFLYNNKLNEVMPMCEKMDGRALIQLYKMCVAHPSGTYNILNEELKLTHNVKLPIGSYTRLLSAMERVGERHAEVVSSIAKARNLRSASRPRITLPPPPILVSSSPPISPQQSFHSPPAVLHTRDLHSPYDIVVNSNASTSDVLKEAQRLAPHVKSINPSQRRTLYI
ncbi:unnamed protein product [Adineta steineri]|uniref:TIR domain-containing protein n=1 Tax=Adineta steineri TaxID=433720 RepID=A0A815P4L0_9BILA|nr:unnamed protein product [Adineta steineri]